MTSYLFEAFFLGLSTGPMCLAYCTPVLVPFMVSEEKYKLFHLLRLSLFFLFGRLIGYMIIGLVTGILGNALSGYMKNSFFPVVTILMGVALLIFGLLKNFPEAKLCCRWSGSNASGFIGISAIGLLIGFNICPPFIAAITDSLTIGTISGSILYFVSFFIATSLFLLPLFLLGTFSRIKTLRSIAKICLILCAIWFLYKGTVIWITQ